MVNSSNDIDKDPRTDLLPISSSLLLMHTVDELSFLVLRVERGSESWYAGGSCFQVSQALPPSTLKERLCRSYVVGIWVACWVDPTVPKLENPNPQPSASISSPKP